MHVIEQRLGLRHANFTPPLNWLAANLAFDRIQRAYAPERLAVSTRSSHLDEAFEVNGGIKQASSDAVASR
jgi:hypothetical protein